MNENWPRDNIMVSRRIFLSNEQIETLAREIVKELDDVPPWNYRKRKTTISDGIEKIQSLMARNITTIVEHDPDCKVKTILASIIADRLKTPEQHRG